MVFRAISGYFRRFQIDLQVRSFDSVRYGLMSTRFLPFRDHFHFLEKRWARAHVGPGPTWARAHVGPGPPYRLMRNRFGASIRKIPHPGDPRGWVCKTLSPLFRLTWAVSYVFVEVFLLFYCVFVRPNPKPS